MRLHCTRIATVLALIILAMVTLFFAATSAHAAIVAATDFNSTTKSAASQDMTNIIWTGDDLLAVTPNTTISTVASNNAGYFASGYGATAFAPDQNIENEGPWAATVDLTLNPGYTGSLTSIAFDFQMLNNSGDNQSGNHPSLFDITVNGNTYDSQQATGSNLSGSILFTDLESLLTGSNTIVITASEVGGPGNNIGIDNLVLNGDVASTAFVPEPASLAGWGLLALIGGTCVLRRRRAKH